MEGKSIYKAPNGKLLKIVLQSKENRVRALKICGDFFLHPEEAITLLEESLVGEELKEGKLWKKISSIVESNSIRLFGFNPEDLAKAIMMAVAK